MASSVCASRARPKKEFHSKLSITVEEADESLFWLEGLQESKIQANEAEIKRF